MQEWSLPIPPDEAMRVVAYLIRKRWGTCTPDQVSDVMLAVVRNAWRYDPNRGRVTTFLAQVAFSVITRRRARQEYWEERRWQELPDEFCGSDDGSEDITIIAPPELQAVVDRLSVAAERLADDLDASVDRYVKDAVALAERMVAWHNTWFL